MVGSLDFVNSMLLINSQYQQVLIGAILVGLQNIWPWVLCEYCKTNYIAEVSGAIF